MVTESAPDGPSTHSMLLSEYVLLCCKKNCKTESQTKRNMNPEAKMIAAVMYCQNPVIRRMQKLADRAKWLYKYAPDNRLTEKEYRTLLTNPLVKHFETLPPRVKDQTIKQHDERSRLLYKIWVESCFKADDKLEEATLCIAAAAEDQRAEHEQRLKESEEKKRAHDNAMSRKRKASGAVDDMVAAAVQVVEAAAHANPNDPRLKRLKAIINSR